MHLVSPKTTRQSDGITIREPTESDGAEIWHLVKAPERSTRTRCTATFCSARTSPRPAPWRSGMGKRSAGSPATFRRRIRDRLFVWQVCVREDARGNGLGKRLIRDILARRACRDVSHVNTTITDDNAASWSLFGKLARSLDADLERTEHFEEEAHFDGHHATEHLVSIGPFTPLRRALKSAA